MAKLVGLLGKLLILKSHYSVMNVVNVQKGGAVDYIINRKTQAILHMDSPYYRTKIYEENRVIYSKHHPLQIIDYSTTLNGSSVQGRSKTVKRILKSKSKLPIPVIPNLGMFLFPTTSVRNRDCVCLSYYHVKEFKQHGNKLAVILKDDKVLLLDISYNQFDLQIKRTSQVIAYFHRLLVLNPSSEE